MFENIKYIKFVNRLKSANIILDYLDQGGLPPLAKDGAPPMVQQETIISLNKVIIGCFPPSLPQQLFFFALKNFPS